MNWRRVPGGYVCPPYSVKWQSGGKWRATRQADKHQFPTPLGRFATANEALAACEVHQEEARKQWA